MNFKKLVCSLTLVALTTPLIFGQISPTAKQPAEDNAELKKEAVTFLRETMADVNNLRTLENRISFSAELAGLMWFYDEKEAKDLYLVAFGNFRDLLMQYDQQMNQFAAVDGEEDDPYRYRRGGIFGEMTDKARLSRKFGMALQVRQQIAMGLAEHDAELAFSFYFDTTSAVSNPVFRRQMEDRDEFFEAKLMSEIAKTNAAKATQFAIKAIEDGVGYQHLDLLKKIYEKDPEKGAEFASAMLAKIKSKDGAKELWVTSGFLNIAGEALEKSKAQGGKKPMLDQNALRELADALGQAILDNDDDESSGSQYIGQIEKYSPSRAAQIRTKFRSAARSGGGNSNSGYGSGSGIGYANSASNAANSATGVSTNSRAERERLEQEKADTEFKKNVEKLGTKELPKEEREKVVEQARMILMRAPGKDKKIMGLSSLAAQVAKAGDKELAAEIMKDAQALVNPMPKNYQDFTLSWMLASGYAESDPSKAFPLLEDTIMRANDTLAAFIKVGEFIDVAGEMIDEGEVQVGAFGGQMVRGLTSELGMADATLKTLAKADFKKTKDLANRFDRSEVRILAKMMILRAVLGGAESDKAKQEKKLEEITVS